MRTALRSLQVIQLLAILDLSFTTLKLNRWSYVQDPLHAVSEHIMLDLLDRVRARPCFSYITDLSSDISNVRYFDITKMSPDTVYLCSVRLLGKDAQSIFNAIECISNTLDLDINEKLVAFCADGDNSMQGWRSGVLARLQQHCNSVFGVHCAAHRHVLAVSDVGQSSNVLKGLDSLLTAAHKMFGRKPKRFGQWENFAQMHSLTKFKFPRYNDTRWWSRAACVYMLIQSFPVLFKYLNYLCRTSSKVLWGGGLPVFMRMTRISDVLVLFAVGDMLACLEPCRKLFERDNAVLSDIRSSVDRVMRSLASIFSPDIDACGGKYMKLLLSQTSNLHESNGVIKFVQKGITVPIKVDEPVDEIYDSVCSIANRMQARMRERFPSQEMPVIECFQVPEFETYESMRDSPMHEIDDYGIVEMTQLLDHLSDTQRKNGFY